MIQTIKNLFNKVFPPSAPSLHSEHIWKPINIDEYKSKYNLVNAGKEDGANNHPPADSAEPTCETELKIIEYFKSDLQRCIENVVQYRDYFDKKLNPCNLLGLSVDLQGIVNTARINIESIGAEARNAISATKRDLAQAKIELSHFKKLPILNCRAAKYPESGILNCSIIIACILLETLGNAFFFAQGSDLGFLGGLGIAFLLSSINVANGGVMGRWLVPQLNVNSWLNKLIYPSMIFCSVGFAVFWNLFICSYRELAGSTSYSSGQMSEFPLFAKSLEGAFNSPTVFAVINEIIGISLKTFDAWLLFIWGLLCFGLVGYKSYQLDDPYPGYGHADRRLRQCEGNYTKTITEYRSKMSRATENALENILSIKNKVERYHQDYAKISSEYDAVKSKAIGKIQSNIGLLSVLLGTYWDSNVAARTSPQPDYFHKWKPKIETPNFPELSASAQSTNEYNEFVLKPSEAAQSVLMGIMEQQLKTMQEVAEVET